MAILRNSNRKHFFEEMQGRKIVCFGAGIMFGDFLRECAVYKAEEKIAYLIDNDSEKWGMKRRGCYDTFFEIKPVEELKKIDASKYVILLLGQHFQEMIRQLDAMPEMDYIEVYIYALIQHCTQGDICAEEKNNVMQIPKTIHYCWFGGTSLPELDKLCIESWKKYCPDYEIVCWDESNYDISKHPYMKQAYENRAFAFVSDYARLDIIYNYGGIYLDTDVELKKSLDTLLHYNAYCGYIHHGTRINTGIGFGAKKGFGIIQEWMDAYKYQFYERYNGTFNQKLCTEYQTDVLRYHRNFMMNGNYQIVDGLAICPKEYFDPLSCILGLEKSTEHTYSIHYNGLSWCDDKYESLKNIRKRAKRDVKKIMERIAMGGDKTLPV